MEELLDRLHAIDPKEHDRDVLDFFTPAEVEALIRSTLQTPVAVPTLKIENLVADGT